MKSLKYIVAATLLFAAFAATDVSAKRKMMPQVYIFGFSAAFTDSIVYMTNVQAVDSAWIDTKTKFLLGRDSYTYQLKNFFTQKQNLQNRTCMVFFATDRSDAEKKYLKMKRKYTTEAKNKYDVRYIDESDFRFKAVDMSDEEEQPVVKVKAKKTKGGKGKPGRPGGPEVPEGNGGPSPR